ncbi:hypothetical protein JNW88_29195, partial [Micromonospora sp. ATA32]|nr:hypothetical protein [Micromonospora sp. ATA32]
AADPRFAGDRPPGLTPAGVGELRGLSFRTTGVESPPTPGSRVTGPPA